MKNLKGRPVKESGCLDPIQNVFYTDFDGIHFIMRQPRKKDNRALRVAWKKVSEESKRRYRRVYVDQSLYDMKKRCLFPLYRGMIPGVLPLVVEVEGEVVGFSDMFFRDGTAFEKFEVPPDAPCCTGSIAALDKFRGMGVGTGYAYTSNAIGRHFNCKWILGTTYMRGGMRSIRAKEGWEIVRKRGGLVDHKKRL